MSDEKITFDKLPEAVTCIMEQLQEIREIVEKKHEPKPEKRLPIGIDEACRIIGKAKPTLYTLVRKRLLPCYKNGKKLYFFEDELLEWISNGKKKTVFEIQNEVQAGCNSFISRSKYMSDNSNSRK